nr:PREDICTED: PRKC apoptosis WT1 regulator protein isoform X1 [Paralichthys olivaceus]XP_019961014.1 PREDICTED: PRKC apoptosis WT1 regulator protein isoform X1 [Paralichthys olivaceus]XP_019961015.1 PREDICTED: PRKC apoptosis WT1 regulator protein isoform X1 [Paralichthys olivaceus]XP_019961016.1 PREDICTED: PRKC apoptosis WT1 regulator protein isoform X1 [Paralichthys olivaceus]
MATGGFKPNATTDFLEEWKAKREKMRAKMLGDIAAASGAPLGSGNPNSTGNNSRLVAAPGTELTNNGNPVRSASSGNCLPSSHSVARSSSGSALKRPEEEEEAHHPAHPAASPASNLKKAPPQPDKAPCASPDSSLVMACNDSDKESPSPGKGKEKKSSGPSARKGKGQIEKRKLREKRRSTGVVSMPSNEQTCTDVTDFSQNRIQSHVSVNPPDFYDQISSLDTNTTVWLYSWFLPSCSPRSVSC